MSPALHGLKLWPTRPHCGQEGVLTPSCQSPPPGDVRGCPRPQTNFIHILWKNLICDNVAAVGFCAWPGRRGCCRCEACAHRFREGDAPAGCQIGRAEVVAQASFSCRHAAIHLLAPYGVEFVLLTLWGSRAADGKRHLLLRAQRALKEGVVIRKRQGEPYGSPSSCAQCGRAGRKYAHMNQQYGKSASA